jgi:hypothetical protein
MNPWHLPYDSAVEDGAERLELLALCLELQLDLLLVALGSETDGTGRPSGEPRPRWDGETLDLTGAESDPVRTGKTQPEPTRPDLTRPDPTRPDPTRPATTLSAIAETVDELLANPEVRRHPSVVARLLGARASFSDRLGVWPRNEAAQPPVPVAVGVGIGVGVEPGHFLG